MNARATFMYFLGLLGLTTQVVSGLFAQRKIIPGAFIVEFEDGQHDEKALFQELEAQGLNATKRTSFDYTVFKGVSIQLETGNPDQLESSSNILQSRLQQASVVKNTWPVEMIDTSHDFLSAQPSDILSANSTANRITRLKQLDNVDTPVGGTSDYAPHHMTQVDKLHAQGISGKGIKIAIVDSGVDYEHPALGGCFGRGCLVSFGYDFVGDGFGDTTQIPQPDDDPMSKCDGHGTHVAGIIAAQENPMGFVGVAHGASIGAYRVLSCSGQTTNELIIKGYSRAFEDGADIISVSISRFSGWHGDATSVVAQRLVERGAVVLTGSGNDAVAYHAMFSIGAAASGLGVQSIGSVQTDRTPVLVEVGSYETRDGFNGSFVYLSGRPVFSQPFTRPVWLVTPERTTDGDGWEVCSPLPDTTPDLGQYVVLVETGTCSDEWSAQEFLHAKGAEFVVYYRNEPDVLFTVPICPDIRGCATVPWAQGISWREQIQAGAELNLTVDSFGQSLRTYRYFNNSGKSGGSVNEWSNWGPTWELDAKIDVLGVGGEVLSLWPTTQGSYRVESGTSMATPQIAGILALLMEATGIRDPSKLHSILQNTASPRQWVENPNRVKALAPVPQQGAGLAQAYNAATSLLIITPSSVSFNDTDALLESAMFALENRGSKDVSYKIHNVPALTVYTFKNGGTFPAKAPLSIAPDAAATLSFSSTLITVPAGAARTLTVTVKPPTGLDVKQLPVYSGFIELEGTDGAGSQSNLTIPYLGIVGSMRSDLTYLQPKEIFLLDNNTRSAQPANTTFESPGNLPAVNYTTQVGTPLLRVDIVPMFETADKVTTKVVDGLEIAGNIFIYPFSPAWKWVDTWNGTVMVDQIPKDLPAGSYAFLVRALRNRGRRDLKEDWVIAKTDPFWLKYVK